MNLSPKLITRGLVSLRPELDKQAQKDLLKTIRELMHQNRDWKGDKWILWGVREGHITSDQLGTLSRAANIVFTMPRNLDDIFETNEIIRRTGIRHSYRMFVPSETYPVLLSDSMRISASHIKFSCQNLIDRFLRSH